MTQDIINQLQELLQLAQASMTMNPPDFDLAYQHAHSALKIARQCQSDQEIAHSLAMLLDVARHQGQYAKAIAYSQEIIQLYADLPHDRIYQTVYYNLGFCYYYLGSFAESLQAHQSQLSIATQLGEQSLVASALRRIGAVHHEMGNFDVALDYYTRTVKIYESIDADKGLGAVYTNIANIYQKQANYDKAIQSEQQAIAIFEKLAGFAGLSRAYATMGSILMDMQQVTEADTYIKKALESAYKTGRHDLISASLRHQALIHIQLKQYDQARTLLEESLERSQKIGDKVEISRLYQQLSNLYEQQQLYDKALEYYRLYHAIGEQLREEATQARFESLEIVHRTQQAQVEAEKQRQLREEDRLYFEKLSNMRNEFMSNASHDLKNPLTSINLHAHMLRRIDPDDYPKREEILRRIEKMVDRMRDLISNLLDLARIETGKSLQIGTVDLYKLLAQTIQDYQAQAEVAKIEVHSDLEAIQALNIQADESQLGRVFGNLLSNALKYTPDPGTLVIKASIQNNQCVISFADNGIGIPEDDIPHLFDRFYRVNDPAHRAVEGTGLGLAICKSIVEQHGGQLIVKSVLHRGTTFTICLPV